MSRKQFASRKFEDCEILDGKTKNKIGHIRVKPSGVLWAPKSAQKWFRVDLKTFANFMEENGKEQRK